MNTREKRKVLSSRQKKLLCSLAEGQTRAAAARAAGYRCETWASTLANSPHFQTELADLQAHAARELVLRLPLLTKLAIDELGKILNGPASPDAKLKAASIVAGLAARCMDRIPPPDPAVLDLVPTEEPQ